MKQLPLFKKIVSCAKDFMKPTYDNFDEEKDHPTAEEIPYADTASIDVREGMTIHNVHCNMIDASDFVPKELWLGRSLYSFLLPLTSSAVKSNKSEKIEDCVGEWESSLKIRKKDFPMLNSAFQSIHQTFPKSQYLSFLRTWVFFLGQHGLIEQKKEIFELKEEDLDFYKHLGIAHEMISTKKVFVKHFPWLLLYGSKNLIIVPGELEVKDDVDI